MKIKHPLLIGWVTAATALVAGFAWEAILSHEIYEGLPPGTIVDYGLPLPLRLMVYVGLYGLIGMALISGILFVKSKLSR